MKKLLGVLVAVACVSGCGGGEGGTNVAAVQQSAEAFCGMLPANARGKAFACLSSQANLQVQTFPDGTRGYCMYASENLGVVGYSVTTYNGGATPVTTQSTASEQSRLLGSQSPGYIRCTRES